MLCISSSQLLSFVISKHGIHINPLKLYAIIDFSTPSSLVQLQRIQEKSNFLQCSVPNYAKLTKGFTCLLTKGVAFHWDNVTHKVLDALKDILIRASLLYPPNYMCDYFMYLIVSISTIAMVLVQEYDVRIEHLINCMI